MRATQLSPRLHRGPLVAGRAARSRRIQAIIDLLLLYPGIGTRTDDPIIRRMTTLPWFAMPLAILPGFRALPEPTFFTASHLARQSGAVIFCWSTRARNGRPPRVLSMIAPRLAGWSDREQPMLRLLAETLEHAVRGVRRGGGIGAA